MKCASCNFKNVQTAKACLKHGNRISCDWLSGAHTAEMPFVLKLGILNAEPLDKQHPCPLLALWSETLRVSEPSSLFLNQLELLSLLTPCIFSSVIWALLKRLAGEKEILNKEKEMLFLMLLLTVIFLLNWYLVENKEMIEGENWWRIKTIILMPRRVCYFKSQSVALDRH